MREFLKGKEGLTIDSELINEIMAEYGKKFNESNDDKDIIKALKTEIKTLKKDIDSYKDTIDSNAKSLENLQNLTNENKDLKAEIQMNGSNVKKEFSKFVRSEVMASVNDEMDFTKALDKYKKDNPQYFGETVVKKVQSSPAMAGGTQPQTTNDIMNSLLRSGRE